MNVRGSYLPSEKGGQKNGMVIRNERFPAYKTSIKKGSEKRIMIASQFKWIQDIKGEKCDESNLFCNAETASVDKLPEFTKVRNESIRPPRIGQQKHTTVNDGVNIPHEKTKNKPIR